MSIIICEPHSLRAGSTSAFVPLSTMTSHPCDAFPQPPSFIDNKIMVGPAQRTCTTRDASSGEVSNLTFLPFAPRSKKSDIFEDIGFAPLLPRTLDTEDRLPARSKKRAKLSPRFKTSSYAILGSCKEEAHSSYTSINEAWISDDDQGEEEEAEEEESACSITSDSKGVASSLQGLELDDPVERRKSWPSIKTTTK